MASGLVVIDNFDLVGMAVLPFETNTVALVYADAILISPVAAKTFQTIPWRDCKLSELPDTVYLVELALNDPPQRRRAAASRCTRVHAVKYVF